MIYHFNDFTVVQLIHLMKGSEFEIGTVSHDAEIATVRISFNNQLNLNPGRYRLEASQVKSLKIDNPKNLENDTLAQIIIEKEPHQITFENNDSSVKLILDQVEIKTIRQ